MGRPKHTPTQSNPSDSAFRVAEKYWRARAIPPDLAKVFDVERIQWESLDNAVDDEASERIRGYWTEEGGERRIECWKVPLCEIGDTGLGTPWKGKEKGEDGEKAFAIIVPAIPGQSASFSISKSNLTLQHRSCSHSSRTPAAVTATTHPCITPFDRSAQQHVPHAALRNTAARIVENCRRLLLPLRSDGSVDCRV